MQSINSRKAREMFRQILDNALQGETVRITRHGEEVARVVPPQRSGDGGLPDLTDFRDTLRGRLKGKPLSQTVIDMRDEERL